MQNWKEKIESYKEEYLADLKALTAIPSVRDPETAGPGAPFGKGIRQAFDCFLDIAERCGFQTEDCGGYA